MKKILWAIGIAVSLAAFLIPSLPAATSVQALNAPRIHVRDGNSTNWSGYSDLPNGRGTFTDVKGSWTIPSVTGATNGSYYSATWVGLDGDGSNTVEQIGTSQDFSNGSASYYAWYEMYPKFPVNLTSFPVAPGDAITAEVRNTGRGTFSLTITDGSTGKNFTTVQKSNNAKMASAEWIMEAPSSSGGVLPLADFGSIGFSGASATYNGHQGNILTASGKDDQINMVNSSGALKASTSPTDGSIFSIAWVSSN